MNEFAYLDDPFKEAPEVGGSVPDGNYTAKIDAVDIVDNKSGEGKHLKFEMLTVGGDYPDSKLFHRKGIPSQEDDPAKARQSLGFLKKTLKSCGVDVESPSFSLGELLSSNLSSLCDRLVSVTVKTKSGSEYPDVYINELISLGDDSDEREPAAVGAGVDPSDPFADE
jgi:hypothetical protein